MRMLACEMLTLLLRLCGHEYLRISGLQEEQVYQAAIAGGKTVSLTYVKLLALGPGQVGKSIFLYRLLGLMKGNIEDTPKEAQPQSSTGQSDLREVCIKYDNMVVAAAPDLSWELCELQSLVEGLMWLLSNQTQDEETETTENLLSSKAKNNKVRKRTLPEDRSNGTDSQEQQSANSVKALESTANTSSGPEPSTNPRVVSPTPLIKLSKATDIINETISEYEILRVKCKHSPNVTKLHMLLNTADVGGQPAFLDMFPSLTIGPALYLLFTKLINDNGHVLSMDDLSKLQPVQYRTKDDNEPQDCENYTYTLQEVIFCALSSIACFGLSDKEVEKYVTVESEAQKTSSHAVLFGTFADKIITEDSRRKLADTESDLKTLLKRTAFYQTDLISFPNPANSDHAGSQVFFEVNNQTGSEHEILRYRKMIQDIIKQKFRKYDIPTSWLGLSFCLKILATKRETYKVSFDDCVELGEHFKMNRKEVQIALEFLHKYVGLILYFPKNKNLRNLVICNPQVVFSSINELTFSVYDSSSRKKQIRDVSSKQKKFEQTGIFNPLEVSYPKETSKIMSINDLVHLLVHLNIAAKITTSIDDTKHKLASEHAQSEASPKTDRKSNDSQEEYFFPAVLKTADTSSLVFDVRAASDEILPEPLCIRFQTGYTPMGFTCALSARLMADEKFNLAPEEQTLYKNKLKLRYNGQFNVIMISLPLQCEFQLSRHHGNKEFHKQDSCPEIMKSICEAINYVLKSMQRTLLSEISYNLAFKCPKHPNLKFGYEPLAKFVYTDKTQTQLKHIKCLDCATTIPDLKPEMKVWFGEVRATMLSVLCVMSTAVFACMQSLTIPPKITKQPTLKKNRILIQAEGTQPMKYQWLKDDEEAPSDGEDYKGTTTAELVIVGTGPQVKGNYKCLVKHKYGVIQSRGTHYGNSLLINCIMDCIINYAHYTDPFVFVLSLQGISEDAISKLIGKLIIIFIIYANHGWIYFRERNSKSKRS